MGEISAKDAASMDTGINVASNPMTAAKASSLGQSNSIDYTPPPEPPPNIIERLERGFTKSVESTPQVIGQGLYYLGSNFHPDATPEEQQEGGSFGDRLAKLGLTMTERNRAEIAAKYPEKPDIWENIGGALPTVGAFGLGAMTGFSEAAAATLAVGGGAQAGINAFAALKAKGIDTEKANLFASVVGAGAGSAMAFGIGNFLKATGPALIQLAKGVVNGYLGGALQTGVTGSLELATGVRDYNGVDSLKQLLVDAHESGTTFALLGGPLGIHQAYVQQRAIEKGYQATGMLPKDAQMAAKRGMAILHEKGIDALEKDIKVTGDEKRRIRTIQLLKSKPLDGSGSPRTDILDEPFVPTEPSRTEALTVELETKKRNLELVKRDITDLSTLLKENEIDQRLEGEPLRQYNELAKGIEDEVKVKLKTIEQDGVQKTKSIDAKYQKDDDALSTKILETNQRLTSVQREGASLEHSISKSVSEKEQEGLYKALKQSQRKEDSFLRDLDSLDKKREELSRNREHDFADVERDLESQKKAVETQKELDLKEVREKIPALEEAKEHLESLQKDKDLLESQIEKLKDTLRPKTNPAHELAQQIAALKRGFRTGRSFTLKDAEHVQKEFNRLIDQSDLELADKAKFRRSIPLTVENFERELPEILDKMRSLEEQAEKRDWIKNLGKVKTQTLEKLPVEYQDALRPLLDSFDLKKRSKDAIAARGRTIEFMRDKLSRSEPLSDGEKAALDAAATKSISEMSHEELRQLHDTIMRVVTEGRMINKYRTNIAARNHDERVGKFLKALDSTEFKDRLDNFDKNSVNRNKNVFQKLAEAARKLNDGLTSPEFMCKWMGTEDFFQSLHEGFQNKLEFRKQYEAALDKIYGKLDYEKVMGKPVDDAKLKELGFTEPPRLDDLMRVYAQSYDEGGYRHLENTMSKAKLEGFLKWFEENHSDLVKIIDKQFDFFREVVGPQVDAVTVDTQGHHIKQVPFYDPIGGSLEDRKGDEIKHQMELGSKSMYDRATPFSGFTKARVESKLAFRKFDYFKNTLGHLSDVANYRAMARTMADANKFFYDPRVVTALRDKFGPEWVSMVHNWLRDTAFDGHQYDNYAARLAANIRANFIFAKLLFNIPSGGKVFAQWGPATSYVGSKWMLPAARDYFMGVKKWDDFIDSNSLQMKNRYFQQERELSDTLNKQGFNHSKLGAVQQGAIKLGMAVHQWADRINTRVTFLGEYRKQMAANEIIGGTQEEAIQAAEKAVRITHPMGGTLYLPDAFRGPEWQKAATTFLNAPNKSFNLLQDNTKELVKGNMNPLDYAVRLFNITVIPAVILAAFNSRRAPTAKEVGFETLNQSLGSELYLGFLTRALVMHTDVAATTPWLAPFTDLMHTFQRKDKIRYGLATADDILGTGTSNLYRLVSGETFKPEAYRSDDRPVTRFNEDSDNPYGSGRI